MTEQFRVVRQSFFGAMTVAQSEATPVTEEEADRLAHAGACFDIVNGRAVQVMRPVGNDGYVSLEGSEQR